jgi:hypothetical protein
MSISDDDTNINVNIQKIILLKFLVRLNFYISSKLTFQNNAETNKNSLINNDKRIKAIMDMYHQESYSNSFIKNIDTSIIYIILQSICNENQSNDKICLEWQKYWKHLIVPRNPKYDDNGQSSVDYLTKMLATNINTVAEFVDTSQKADNFSYKIKEIIRRSGITDKDVEDKIIDNLESTIQDINSVNESKKLTKEKIESDRIVSEKETYDKKQHEKPIKVLIERIQEVFNDTKNLLNKNKTENVNPFKENLKTNFINNDKINSLNKDELSLLYRKNFITEFKTTLEKAIKKQTEYNVLLDKSEFQSEPFKGEIDSLKNNKKDLDKQIKELEDLIKESNNFINSLGNPNKNDQELQNEAIKIVNLNLIEPTVTSSENPNKNALIASMASHHFNQLSFPFFPFLLNNSSPISNTTSPNSNNKNALLASITAQYTNQSSFPFFPFLLNNSSPILPTIYPKSNNKNALLATMASLHLNKNSISIFPFFF